ncbi:MAG: FAD-dependent oxidoreductase [Steroidobacteraceae bacterium]
MKQHARVVVIGGGIGGCSTLYHLTQEGWADVILVERDELTSGTTWHSAAQVTNFGGVQTMVGLKSHSIRLYRELSCDPEYPLNYHHSTGGIRLASTQNHLDGYRHFVSMAKGMGVEFEVIDAAECARRHPLITTDNLLGALWDPLDGDIDPVPLCQALVRRARLAGAEVYRHTPVTALTHKRTGEWIVHTTKGDITCENVVNAGGYRCNEVGAMMGVEHPVASMEHQYFLTDSIPEIETLDRRVPLIRCPTDDFYCRQDKKGLLVGFYEQDCKTWGLDGIDPAFTSALCPNDTERVMPVLENVIRRLPCLGEVGIRTIINGPITYTPDGLPIVGRIPARRNAWCITGLRAGLGEGGGHGWLLAQQIVHGEACYDTWCLDPRRFTGHANIEFTARKAVEDYQNEFRFHLPHEHRPAGRLAKTTPLYAALKAAGGRFGVVNGWERAAYYATSPEFHETHSFRFNNTFDPVAAEVDAVQNRVGLMEISGFNRFEISGAGVHDWLDHLSCSRIARAPGRVSLCYLLSQHGNMQAEATIATIAPDRVWYGSAAASEYHDMDWLTSHLPADGSISIRSLTGTHTILVVAGPRSRPLLERVAPRTNWSAEAFPWLRAREVRLAHFPAMALSVSFTGELSWELHVPNEALYGCYQTLIEAGADLGLAHFGLYATESMRLEKGFRHWKSDLITEFNPIESGLGRFVQLGKDFVGKPALEAMLCRPPRRRFVTLAIDGRNAPAHPGDSILDDGAVIGTISSAAWGHRVNRNLAMGFVQPGYAEVGTPVTVEVIGESRRAVVCDEVTYDPAFTRVRS